jgi:type IV secretion system protein TrbL
MQVFQNTVKHVNFLQAESIVAPIIIALIILIVCALIAVNMILLLCAAWVVVYAGLIFLGFGGCRWTSDMAINYYRTILGVGVSLMTMQLIIGIGVKYLQDLFIASGQTPDAPTLAILMVACIVLAVVAHRLPQMVAGMVVGGGHNGAIGGVGIMTLLGAAIAGTSIVGSAAAAARTAGVGTAAAELHQRLLDRIQAAEEATASGSGNGNFGSTNTPARQGASDAGGGVTGASRNPAGTDMGGSHRPTPTSSTSRPPNSAAEKKTPTEQGPAASPRVEEPEEPPLTRPMTPDEQRGFPPPTDPPEWETKS